jgi:hypothetical protein
VAETGHDDKLHNQTGIQGSPVVANGTVFFGCPDSNVYTLDAKTGKLRWKQNNKGSWVIATPAVRDGAVYFPTFDSLQFIALDAATGKILFTLPTKAYGFSSPAIAGGLAFFGTFDGIVHAVDLRARKYISPFRTPEAQAHEKTLFTRDGHLNMDAIFGPEPTLEAMSASVGRLLSLGSFVGSRWLRTKRSLSEAPTAVCMPSISPTSE